MTQLGPFFNIRLVKISEPDYYFSIVFSIIELNPNNDYLKTYLLYLGLNANANHRIDTLDAEAESMVSRLTSDNFKIGPSSHTPLAPLTNNKWYYRDPQGEVQGKLFLSN